MSSSKEDFCQIRIGNHPVGIIGLNTLLELLAAKAAMSDSQAGDILLEELGKTNYIPNSVRDKYRDAFVREYRRRIGLPVVLEKVEGIDIKVLGQGCAQCDQLEQLIMQVLEEDHVTAGLEHVRDLKEIAKLGVISVPALLINGRVVTIGTVPTKEKIRTLIRSALERT